MRTLIFATALSFSFLFAPSTIFAGEPDTKLHQNCIYPTVMVIGKNSKESTVGTGVVVKSKKIGEKKWVHHFLSVAHILLDPDLVEGKDAEGKDVTLSVDPIYTVRVGVYKDWSTYVDHKEYPSKVIHYEKGVDKDISLFSFESDGPVAVAEIYKDPKLYIGNDICRMGCGLGEAFRIDFGKITSIKESVKDRPITATHGTYRISALTLPGDSGGPVYHEYKLIGITQTIRAMPAATSFMPPTPVHHMTYVIPIERYLNCKEIAKHIS